MSRGFSRITHRQAEKDGLTIREFETVIVPTRATINSAGYDIRSAIDAVVMPGESERIPTGIRAYMLDDEVLLVHIRSSLGFKYNVRLSNATGVIDSDYFYADNEGHIWLGVYNDGELPFEISCGDRIAQGIFMKYLVANDVVHTVRTGGLGSTE
jgi:dUTP pyrophosphatase